MQGVHYFLCVRCPRGETTLPPFSVLHYTVYMDNQTDPTTQQDNKIPEPPALEIDIRTMESDIKAFNEGGGEVPTEGVQESMVSHRPDDAPKSAASAYTGPEKPLFEAPATPVTPASAQPQASKGMGKTLALTIAIIVGIIVLGLLGYFVIFPYIFKLI